MVDRGIEIELPTSSRKQLIKLGDIFTYREGSDDAVCQICQESCAGWKAMGRLENRLSVILSRRFICFRSLNYDARNL